jgi:FSR family fosmidomycin resistance protein-like MFS transporter
VGTLSARKGLFFSLFAASGSVGLSISQISFYNVYGYLDGETAILALPLATLGLLCLFIPFQAKSEGPKKKVKFTAMLQLFKRKDFRLLYCVQVCNQALFWGTIFILPDVLTRMGCDEWVSYGGGHMALILGGAAMMIPGGILADIYSPKTVMITAISMSVIGLYTFVSLETTSPLVILSVLALTGSAFGVLVPMGLAAGHQMLPENPSLASAFVMGMVWCVAESLAPTSGILTTLYSGANPAAQALATMGVINIVGLFAAWRLPTLATASAPTTS